MKFGVFFVVFLPLQNANDGKDWGLVAVLTVMRKVFPSMEIGSTQFNAGKDCESIPIDPSS
jgi:hypothetical protein